MPLDIAVCLASSAQAPIIGLKIVTPAIPAPPTRERPNAPVLGKYSATQPNIVGPK